MAESTSSSSGAEIEAEAGTTVGKRMMWFVVLWLVGFAGTMLLALPFHFLVAASMHR